MTADDVVGVLGGLDAAGIWYCVEGGWGVDALLGAQTREHDDLDLGVRLDDVDRICSAFSEFTRDDVEWPSSFVLRDEGGKKIDAHPLTFDASGDGWQAMVHGPPSRWPREHLDARGRIGGRDVRCITPQLQLRWHEYDGVDDVDWEDMRRLCERFELTPPHALAARPGFIATKRRRLPG
jgi:lincosamide nucleotidyltransferase A/C/D/E